MIKEKDIQKFLKIVHKRQLMGEKLIQVNHLMRDYKLEQDWIQKVLDAMNAKGYLDGHGLMNTGRVGFRLTEPGISECKNANIKGLRRIHSRWGERKDGRQLILNILFLIFMGLSIFWYITNGEKITDIYQVIDEIRENS